jgi:hypothetical protein
MITMFQKCAQWSEKECLADQLGFKQRVATCVKMINIAVHCLKLGNYPVSIAMISGLGPLVTPSSLWEEVPERYRNQHQSIKTHLMKGGFSTEGYNIHKRQFKGKFYIPALVPSLKAFDLKINCQPTFHAQSFDGIQLIHLKKFVTLHDTIKTFLEPQMLACDLIPNHQLQWSIAHRMASCGRVTNTGATSAERSNRAQYKKVSEQIETEAVAKKLSYLGF